MIFLPYAAKLIRILNDKAAPGQIAAGFALGAVLGLVPGFNLTSLFFLAAILVLNVNMSAAFLAVPVFKAVGAAWDPWADAVGAAMLTGAPALSPVWTWLYNLPFAPFTRFNNTVVMGNLVLGMVFFFPMVFLVRKFVVVYRLRWRDRINRLGIVQAFQAGKIYRLWQSISRFRGE